MHWPVVKHSFAARALACIGMLLNRDTASDARRLLNLGQLGHEALMLQQSTTRALHMELFASFADILRHPAVQTNGVV